MELIEATIGTRSDCITLQRHELGFDVTDFCSHSYTIPECDDTEIYFSSKYLHE